MAVVSECADYGNFIGRAFCEGGTVMYLILVVGILTVFLILERAMSLSKLTLDKTSLNENLFSMMLRGDIKQAIAFCDSRPTPLTNTLKSGLVQVMNKRPDEEVQVAMDAAVLRETPRLEGWTSFLAVFGNVSVLIGLFGTIVGLIRSFSGVAEADAATKAARLSLGISEALNCTAFGLLVAILAIVTFGFYQIKIGRAINDMLESSMNLMNLVVSNRDKIKY
ncbi:MAG: MotA/TolQ/ExbB proton channel family protein [Bdellovibrionales bacterium]|nr:MotA/TolQ/ExbB proton channel family protein [Bdellovibrionales bacterium]